jgi:putative ABC transport system permease protein
VVRDFHYRILEHGIEPFALRYAPNEYGLLHVRLAAGDPMEALASLEAIWEKMDIVHPFNAEFMDDSIQKAYSHVTFVGGLVSFFALLSLSLACMGLLGSVTQSVGSKIKEIGIRKVVGATTAQVTLLLSRRFLVLLIIAVAIAMPLGFWLSNLFLTLFVYRIAVGGLILGGSALVLLALGLLTVGVQTARAALANPVMSLRNE